CYTGNLNDRSLSVEDGPYKVHPTEPHIGTIWVHRLFLLDNSNGLDGLQLLLQTSDLLVPHLDLLQ
ncbi:hypothetical protein A2U01_0075643, partial [Trifolium medium]|nr:hypothetical protein [Trifolium medium]